MASSLGPPRRRRAQVVARRASVLAVEVPTPALRLAVLVEEHPEAPALLPVEVLHHQPPAPAGPCGEVLGSGEELVGGHEAHAQALEPAPGRHAVGLRAHDLPLALERPGEAVDPPTLHDLYVPLLAQFGGEVPHPAQHEMGPAAVRAHPAQGFERLHEQHAPRTLQRRVVAHELVAQHECGVTSSHRSAYCPRAPPSDGPRASLAPRRSSPDLLGG